MKRKVLLSIIAVCMVLAMGITIAARMTTSGGEAIDRDVLATAGNRSMSGQGHALYATVGQPVVGLSTAGNGSTLVHGFHVMLERGPTAAKRWELY